MSLSPLIDQLIDSLRCLPGVGHKTAQRMALHLLERDREGGLAMSETLDKALHAVKRCGSCRTLTELDFCNICSNDKRDAQLLCVVESPTDVLAFEQAGSFRGRYFVLMGHLSPIDGIGPAEIGVSDLVQLVAQQQVREVILATNPTIEGEATAFYITEQLKEKGVTVSRIAHGVPLGGELEYIDGGTLAHALQDRKVIE